MPTLTRPTTDDRADQTDRPTDSADTPRRARAKRGEGELLRAAILDAVDTLLEQARERGSGCGEEAVSIRAVAEMVGCTPPAIYLHFFDKHDLLTEVCARRFARCIAESEEALARITDPVTALEGEARALVAFGLAHPEHYRVLFMGRGTPPGLRVAELQGEELVGFDRLRSAARAAVRARAVSLTDAGLVAHGVWMVAHGIVSLLIARPGPDRPAVDALLRDVLHRYVTSLRADPPAR